VEVGHDRSGLPGHRDGDAAAQLVPRQRGARAVVLAHARQAADLAGRPQFLRGGALAAGSYLAWELQHPLSACFELRGARRRFTGSYEAGSLAGNGFPLTSWVADSPRALPDDSYRLELRGLVARPLRLPLAELQVRDTLVATLDCTGGFYSRRRWSGVRLARLLERAGPLPTASHVRVISHTGYRWSFDLRDARRLLLATSVGGEPLSHEHGAGAAHRARPAPISVREVGGSRRVARRT
jgi:DMSO/TMAO reductase YedYZ molybdopterin-dependent catalytic subunit